MRRKVIVMSDQKAQLFIQNIFQNILKAKSIDDLNILITSNEIDFKNRLRIGVYPKIEFSITKAEVLCLIHEGLISDNHELKDLHLKLSDPLSKLLFATIWKQGDLLKVKHIIKGILNCDEVNSTQEEALVFYNFGKYLTKKAGQPIIDQHVIRAFAVYKNINDLEKILYYWEKFKVTNELIRDYKDWLTSLTNELKSNSEYAYYVDKVLYTAGKTIKFIPKSNEKSTNE